MKFKRNSFLITLCALMATFVSSGCSIGGMYGFGGQPTGQQGTGSTTTTSSTYYSSISDNLTGSQLISALHNINVANKVKTINYGGIPGKAKYMDADPNGSGKIVSFYSRKLIGPTWDSGKTWNREHVWPASHGGNLVENDGHMVRPCSTSDNGDRGNAFYSTGTYDPGCLGFPNYRGIAARIIFYCAIAEPTLKIIDSTSGGGNQMGRLSDLLRWNLQYKPSTSETADLELKVEQIRNNYLADPKVQGNRNPFIDHPEYACRIWGLTNSTTKSICGM